VGVVGGFVGAVVVPVVGGGDGGVVGGGVTGVVGGGVAGGAVSVVVGSGGMSVGSSWAPAVPVTPSAASAHSVKTMPRATFRNPLTDTPRRPSGMPTPDRTKRTVRGGRQHAAWSNRRTLVSLR
jgi:hypothetical protein